MVVAAAARPARRMECAGRCIKLLLVSLSLVVLLRSPGAEAVMGDLASLQQEAALSACCPAASAWVAPANSTTADGGALLADVIALTHDETASGTSLEGHVVVVCDGGCHGTLRRNCWQQQVYPPSVRGSPLTDCPRGFALFAFPSPKILLRVGVQRFAGDNCTDVLEIGDGNSFLVDLATDVCLFDRYSVIPSTRWHLTGYTDALSAAQADFPALVELLLDGRDALARSAPDTPPGTAYYSQGNKAARPLAVLGHPVAVRAADVAELNLHWNTLAVAWPAAARQVVVVRGLMPVPATGSYRLAFRTDHTVAIRVDSRPVATLRVAGEVAPPKVIHHALFLARGLRLVEIVAVVPPAAQRLQLFGEAIAPQRPLGLCVFPHATACNATVTALKTHDGSGLVALPLTPVEVAAGEIAVLPLAVGSCFGDDSIATLLVTISTRDEGNASVPVVRLRTKDGEAQHHSMTDGAGEGLVPGECMPLVADSGPPPVALLVQLCDVLNTRCDNRPGALCQLVCPAGMIGKYTLYCTARGVWEDVSPPTACHAAIVREADDSHVGMDLDVGKVAAGSDPLEAAIRFVGRDRSRRAGYSFFSPTDGLASTLTLTAKEFEFSDVVFAETTVQLDLICQGPELVSAAAYIACFTTFIEQAQLVIDIDRTAQGEKAVVAMSVNDRLLLFTIGQGGEARFPLRLGQGRTPLHVEAEFARIRLLQRRWLKVETTGPVTLRWRIEAPQAQPYHHTPQSANVLLVCHLSSEQCPPAPGTTPYYCLPVMPNMCTLCDFRSLDAEDSDTPVASARRHIVLVRPLYSSLANRTDSNSNENSNLTLLTPHFKTAFYPDQASCLRAARDPLPNVEDGSALGVCLSHSDVGLQAEELDGFVSVMRPCPTGRPAVLDTLDSRFFDRSARCDFWRQDRGPGARCQLPCAPGFSGSLKLVCSALGVWEREGADGDACDGTQYDAITARLAVARGSGLWRAEYHALPKMALTSGPWTVRSIAEVSAITRYQEPDVVRHVSQIKLQAESGDAPVPFPYAQFFVLNYTTTLVFDEPRRLAVAMSCSGQYELTLGTTVVSDTFSSHFFGESHDVMLHVPAGAIEAQFLFVFAPLTLSGESGDVLVIPTAVSCSASFHIYPAVAGVLPQLWPNVGPVEPVLLALSGPNNDSSAAGSANLDTVYLSLQENVCNALTYTGRESVRHSFAVYRAPLDDSLALVFQAFTTADCGAGRHPPVDLLLLKPSEAMPLALDNPDLATSYDTVTYEPLCDNVALLRLWRSLPGVNNNTAVQDTPHCLPALHGRAACRMLCDPHGDSGGAVVDFFCTDGEWAAARDAKGRTGCEKQPPMSALSPPPADVLPPAYTRNHCKDTPRVRLCELEVAPTYENCTPPQYTYMYYIRSDLGSAYRPEHALNASDCVLRTPCAANATLDWTSANANHSVSFSLACDPATATCTTTVPLAIVDLTKEVFFGEACTESQSPVQATLVASTCVSGTWGPLREVHTRHRFFTCWSTKTALVGALIDNAARSATTTTVATSTTVSSTLSTVPDTTLTTTTMSDNAEAGSSNGRNSIPTVLVAVVVVTLFGLLASVGFLVAKRRAARRVQTRRLDSVIPAHCLTEAADQFALRYASVLDGEAACSDMYDKLLVPASALELTPTVLGKGQFGTVLLGRLRPQEGRRWFQRRSASNTHEWSEVAVKTIRLSSTLGSGSTAANKTALAAPGSSSDADVQPSGAEYTELTQILLEARLMAALSHPHLVPLLAVSASQLPVLLALEYCRHGSLKDFLRRRPACTQVDYAGACFDMALQAARGVQYLHSKLCVHRDLAARNVLVTDLPSEHSSTAFRCGHVLKLADLGLSRVLRTEQDYYRKRSDDAVPIKWQCPVSVESRTYTAKSDVYSYGVLLWEIFSLGQAPFAHLTAAEAFRAARQGERPRKPHTDMPASAYALQLTCMASQLTARPTMTSVVQQLEHLLRDWPMAPPKTARGGEQRVPNGSASLPGMASNHAFFLESPGDAGAEPGEDASAQLEESVL